MEEKKIVCDEIIERPDGSAGFGNRAEYSEDDAIAGIREGKLRAAGFPKGVVPGEKKSGKKSKKKVEGEE